MLELEKPVFMFLSLHSDIVEAKLRQLVDINFAEHIDVPSYVLYVIIDIGLNPQDKEAIDCLRDHNHIPILLVRTLGNFPFDPSVYASYGCHVVGPFTQTPDNTIEVAPAVLQDLKNLVQVNNVM